MLKKIVSLTILSVFALTAFTQQGPKNKQYIAENHSAAKVDTFALENNLSPAKAEALKETIANYQDKRKSLKSNENTTKEEWKAFRTERQEAIKAVLDDEELYEKWYAAHAKERKEGAKQKHQHQRKHQHQKGKD